MKKLLFLVVLGIVLVTAHTEEASAKVYWDGVELKFGQLGRLSVLKDTELFKLEGEKKIYARTLKAGELYKIYAFKPGMLSVGGGYYVNRDSKVKYETPSKAKLFLARQEHLEKLNNENYHMCKKPEPNKGYDFQFVLDEEFALNLSKGFLKIGDFNFSLNEPEKNKELYKNSAQECDNVYWLGKRNGRNFYAQATEYYFNKGGYDSAAGSIKVQVSFIEGYKWPEISMHSMGEGGIFYGDWMSMLEQVNIPSQYITTGLLFQSVEGLLGDQYRFSFAINRENKIVDMYISPLNLYGDY